MFTDCSNYAPAVDEEVPRFTYVFQVHAEDMDPIEDGGMSYPSSVHRKRDLVGLTGCLRKYQQTRNSDSGPLEQSRVLDGASDLNRIFQRGLSLSLSLKPAINSNKFLSPVYARKLFMKHPCEACTQ